MKKFLTFVLVLTFTLFAFNSIANAAQTTNKSTKQKKTYSEKEYDVITKDNHKIRAYLSYPKTKQKGYPTIILLHSISYNSSYWIPMQTKFNNLGFAVLRIDLRGHGKSVYTKSLHQRSWTSFKTKDFQKYPDDVIEVIKSITKETKKADFSNYAIVGSDLGANTAVLVATKLPHLPKALVLISPSMTYKGLYIPVKMTELGSTPILAITSKTDKVYMEEQMKLARFAQSSFDIYNVNNGRSDMIMLKQHPEVEKMIVGWVSKHFKGKK